MRSSASSSERPSWAERLFRLSLWLYPIAFRRAHSEEMLRTFRDLERDAAVAGRRGRFRLAALYDAFTGPVEARRQPVYGPPLHLRPREAFVLTTLPHDFRLTVRRLVRNPTFTLVAVLTMALGIGANTAIFSAVYGVLFRPLEMDEPERLAVLSLHRAEMPSDIMGFFPKHAQILRDLLEGRGFDGLASFMWESVTLEGRGGTDDDVQVAAVEIGAALMVDGAFFELMGVEPLRGRILGPRDVVPNHRGQTAVLSEALWSQQFGRDEAVIGQKLILDGHPVRVVGVMPEGVPLPQTGVSLWMTQGWNTEDRSLWFRLSMMVRLAPEMSFEQAEARLAVAADDLVASHRRLAGYTIGVTEFDESLVGSARPALVALAVGVGLILVLACANLASLLLARVSRQRQDVATRRALGARWSHLAGQQLMESSVLALLGGAAGWVLALGLHRLLTTLGAGLLPRLSDMRLDIPVLVFALGVSVLTGLGVGLVPVLHTFTHDLASTLRGGRMAPAGAHRTRGVLVAVQVALAVALAVGAGLMVRTLAELSAVQPGFDATGVGAARVYLDDESYGEDSQQRLYIETLLDAIRSRSDVALAGATSGLPFDPITLDYDLPYVLHGEAESASRQAQFRVITVGYLETMKIPLLRGRAFGRRDHERAEPVALINETFAHVAWPERNPVGETFAIYGGRRTLRVVGVVGDVAFRGPSDLARPEFYLPHDQNSSSVMTVVAASEIDSSGAGIARAIAEEALVIDPRQPVHSFTTMATLREQSVARPRFLTLLLGSFAAVSLVLAAAGIYGMLAGWIAESRRELGLRMALGAEGHDIVALVVRRGLIATASGAVVGLGLAQLGAVYLVPFLFGTGIGDLTVYVLVSCATVTLSVGVSLLPAVRAARIEPSRVLTIE